MQVRVLITHNFLVKQPLRIVIVIVIVIIIARFYARLHVDCQLAKRRWLHSLVAPCQPASLCPSSPWQVDNIILFMFIDIVGQISSS